MSFNINDPSNIPSIQETQSMKNNGGGGNLGYFMREESDEIIKFSDNQEEDSFEKSSDKDLDESQFLSLFDKFIRFIKKICSYILNFFITKTKSSTDEFIKK